MSPPESEVERWEGLLKRLAASPSERTEFLGRLLGEATCRQLGIFPIPPGFKLSVVFGSRFIGDRHRVLYFWHYVANHFLTMLSNMFTNLNLTDMETCYKVFRREVLEGIRIKSNRFGFEPEITAKVAKKRNPSWRIFEIPISYSGRTYEEGKKIGLRDAFTALYCIVRYRLFD